MARYRHWRNHGKGGQTVFVTATCLDFRHAFRRDEIKTQMARRIVSDHLRYEAKLRAYVVMSHHVHFVTTLPPDRDVSWFVQRVKSNSAKELMPLLTSEELAGFDQQRGLDGRSFWMRSFRGLLIQTEGMLHQKVWYTHQNPVRAGLVTEAEAYPWSSAAVYAERYSVEEAERCLASDCLAALARL